MTRTAYFLLRQFVKKTVVRFLRESNTRLIPYFENIGPGNVQDVLVGLKLDSRVKLVSGSVRAIGGAAFSSASKRHHALF